MKLLLERYEFTEKSSIGRLFVDNKFFCYTLEDKDRKLENGKEAKVYGQTAIPRGLYEVVIDYSNRFKCQMPRLLDVPQFVGIRIHAGNSHVDTDGCILVGTGVGKDWLFNSRAAYNKLMKILEEALDKNETVQIEVK